MTRSRLHALVLLLPLALAGCSPLTVTIGGTAGQDELRTKVVEDVGGFGADRVAIVDVSGMIFNANESGLFSSGENPVSLLHEQLQKAKKDSRVKAVILRLNTPGGTVTASDVMYRDVLRFKQQTGKPVVVCMMDVAASGGYYLACAGDHIVAYPSTVTASIGVIMQLVSLQPALTNWGITAEALTSGPNKAAGSPFAKMTDEQRATLQDLVDTFYGNFSAIVRSARPNIPPERFAQVTDGRVLSGVDAYEAGLVDQVGDLHDAFEKAKQMAGIQVAQLVRYHRPTQGVGSMYARTPVGEGERSIGTQINLLQLNVPDTFAGSRVGFYYLWSPGAP